MDAELDLVGAHSSKVRGPCLQHMLQRGNPPSPVLRFYHGLIQFYLLRNQIFGPMSSFMDAGTSLVSQEEQSVRCPRRSLKRKALLAGGTTFRLQGSRDPWQGCAAR